MAATSDYAAEVLESPNSHELLQTVLTGQSGISKRHFALDDITNVFQLDGGALNQAFEKHAPLLAGEALAKALEKSGTRADELDAVIICTCTGYLCPGVTSHVAEQLGMRNDAVLHDIVGLGCGAAIPSLRTASDFLAANPQAKVGVVAVEVCSAAFFLSDDPGVLISLCLFGDGASASVWSGEDSADAMLRVHSFRSRHVPEEREKIRFLNEGGKLRNKLHRGVPGIAARTLADMHAETPAATNRPVRAITHTGGRDVLNAIRRELPQYDLAESEHILDQYGNVSSPSVMLALEHYLENTRPSEDESLFLGAFGAGFNCYTCWAET